ncbi:MAG: hypothetical protein GC152_01945 [Alphaproteobacteria bacterium]|nr:hypothetical protein [Alphaproteobacteria bacterium]
MGGRGRRLDEEEERLWRRVARTVTRRNARPMDPALIDSHNPSDSGRYKDDVGVQSARPVSVAPRPPAASASSRSAAGANSPRAPSSPAFGAGDPKRDRAVARRRQPIDGVLDLHGMTQDIAHRSFNAFVANAARRRWRCVLVITGKGGPASQANLTRARLADWRTGRAGAESAAEPWRPMRGVLRERVRDWADDPSIRSLIARLAPAQPRDGGDGAYYLFLKAMPSARDGEDR